MPSATLSASALFWSEHPSEPAGFTVHHAHDTMDLQLLTSTTDPTTAWTPVPGPDLHQPHPHPSPGTVQSMAGLKDLARSGRWYGRQMAAELTSACKFASTYELFSPLKNLRHATLTQQQASCRQQHPFYKFLQAHELRAAAAAYSQLARTFGHHFPLKKSSNNYSHRLKVPKSPDFPCKKDHKRSGSTLALFDGIFL